ncbi:MAG: ABC transporter substrate-binding protein [Betaproteobacteria bacterium]
MARSEFATDRPPVVEKRREGMWDRREFIKGAAGLAGSAALLGYDMRLASAEPPPELTKIRITRVPVVCLAPLYVAEELLRLEGFSTVEYVDLPNTQDMELVGSGRADFASAGIETFIPAVDMGQPVVALSGFHSGCLEFFAKPGINGMRDLKGKTVPISAIGTPEHVFISALIAYVGLDPERDINWVDTGKTAESMRLFVEGRADAFLAGPPRAQELHERKIGKVILNIGHDQPWSQYFCCLLVTNRDFLRQNPVATKRATRAFLKAAEICAQDPERVARFLVENKYTARYDVALEILRDLPYRRWREANPEDSVRFFSLRFRDAKIIKSVPQKIIADGTDWRFLNELKKELKT